MTIDADITHDYNLASIHVNNETVVGIHTGSEPPKMIVLNTKTKNAQEYELGIPSGYLYDVRRVEDGLILSVSSGFYLIDLKGSVQKKFVYKTEEEKYSLPAIDGSGLSSGYPPYPFVISDDFQYVSYFEYEINNWWQTILVDTSTGEKSTLLYELFPSDPNEEFYGKSPLAFSPSNEYLFFENIVFRGHNAGFAGGRISLLENRIDLVSEGASRWMWMREIIDDNNLLLIKSGETILSSAKYSFEESEYTDFTEGKISDIYTEVNGRFTVLTSPAGEIRLYNTDINKYSVIYNPPVTPFSFSHKNISASEDGRQIVSFTCTEDGNHLFVLFEVE